jgi:RNA polymerase sigma-70 factor (ECF subfamily)
VKTPFFETFTSMYENYHEKIFRYIYFRLMDEQIARDLTSHVFLKAWENKEHFKPALGPFITWLYKVAHNAIIDYYRTGQELVHLENQEIPSKEPTPEEESELKFSKERLYAAINKLTYDQQHVLFLKYFDGMSTEEVASQLGKRKGTVRALQMRALKSLSRQMEGIH